MRSCRRFLAGIPHLTVDHPRVAHPSATPFFRRRRTFDLHVLGTPPAFILSQDQTRHPMCMYSVALARGGHVHVCVELRSRPSTVVAWLVRRKTLILRPCDRRPCCIDRNCSSPNSCCSAFHSSIVKVFPVEMGRSHSPLFDALHFSSGHFVRLFTVDVVSHISGAVSRGFQTNFLLLRKLPSLAFAGTETFPGLTTTQKSRTKPL